MMGAILMAGLFPFWFFTATTQFYYGEDTADTILHFLLEEPSGNITEEIQGSSLALAAGTANYEIPIADTNYQIDPGIQFISAYFENASLATSPYVITAGSAITIQWWAVDLWEPSSSHGIVELAQSNTDDSGFDVLMSVGVRTLSLPTPLRRLDFILKDNSGVTHTPTFTGAGLYAVNNDGDPHHYRLVSEEGQAAKLYIDGVLRDTASTTRNVPNAIGGLRLERLLVGYTASYPSANCEIFEVKIDKNATANSYPE